MQDAKNVTFWLSDHLINWFIIVSLIQVSAMFSCGRHIMKAKFTGYLWLEGARVNQPISVRLTFMMNK
jgi:hypothetical protein